MQCLARSAQIVVGTVSASISHSDDHLITVVADGRMLHHEMRAAARINTNDAAILNLCVLLLEPTIHSNNNHNNDEDNEQEHKSITRTLHSSTPWSWH